MIYLNGARLKEATRLRRLSLEDIQKKSGLHTKDVDYYWNNPVTVTNQEDVNALAKVLGIDSDLLLVHDEPKVVTLRSDKFSTGNDKE